MRKPRRRLSVAALPLFALAAAAAPLAAQETNESAPATVGPPQLKDFRLPGQRTSPPPQAPPVTAADPPRATAPASGPPGPAAPRAVPRRAVERPQTGPAPAPPATQAAQAPLPQTATVPAGPAPTRPAPRPVVAPGEASALSPILLWIAGGALLALLGFFGLRRLATIRAAAARQARSDARAADRAAAAEAAAEVAAAAVAADLLPRARIELGFVPERAVATDSETAVHYDLVLRNAGEHAARNIRIDARMFNASAQAAIGAFLKGPIHDESGSPLVRIAPGAELKLASSIAMPKDEVRGITVQGRSIFVPIVAINVAYDWGPAGEGAGAGRTSRSWLVGREGEAGSEKMGAFWLDVGPRVYRAVGQRPTEFAHVA